MNDCSTCRFALWDYEEYYPHGVECFVCGCSKNEDPDECGDEYEEVEIEI